MQSLLSKSLFLFCLDGLQPTCYHKSAEIKLNKCIYMFIVTDTVYTRLFLTTSFVGATVHFRHCLWFLKWQQMDGFHWTKWRSSQRASPPGHVDPSTCWASLIGVLSAGLGLISTVVQEETSHRQKQTDRREKSWTADADKFDQLCFPNPWVASSWATSKAQTAFLWST